MSDPTVQRAADVISRQLDSRAVPQWAAYSLPNELAEALAAAGLLADPTTPTLTPEQADVIDAAILVRPFLLGTHSVSATLCVAVDRLVRRLAAATKATQ